MFSKRGSMIVCEPVHAVACRHVPEPCAPERQRIDEGFAQDDLLRYRQRFFVPHPATWARKIHVQRCPWAQPRRDFPPVHLHHFAFEAHDRDHHRAVEVLVAALSQDAHLFETPAQFRSRHTIFLRQPVAERAVGKTHPKTLDHLRGFQSTRFQIPQRFRRLFQRLLVVAHHLQQQRSVVGIAAHRRGQLRHRRTFHRTRRSS